ncbi:Thiamin-phosphate pyrophosphorylase [Caenispirillum salinarum AK4]|uniref:Thiamin-phosphate pyrophosphorylase n=1 Tax=Caenispirillum salinarum AK4 TaxID=1238182 RepID=K9H542_9PROT|nr:thiamine phosphate synthase [Caenispirillum salinarum]EKV32184.1 Thiamin-phosphate pyrophosphorylase [Caenispirillum salinarum AK4]
MKTRTLASRRAGAKTRRVPTLTVTDTRRMPDPAAVAATLPRGAAIVFRHYEAPDRESLGVHLAAVCRRRGISFLVAGDWRLAARLGADGLHLPEGLARHGILSPALLWRRRTGGLLTIAAHDRSALAIAGRLKADAALLSPVFPTASHPGAATLGPWRASLWARTAPRPVMALGGMSPHRVRRLAGVAGWAGTGLA